MFYFFNLIFAQNFNGNAISYADKQSILLYHNIARAQVGSPAIVWDTGMEQSAVSCLQQHQPTSMQHGLCSSIGTLNGAGENLSVGVSGVQGVLGFIGEKCSSPNTAAYTAAYSFSSAEGHWTQAVWRGTQRMSCAQTSPTGVMFCHYLPAGNTMGVSAYPMVPSNSDCTGGTLDQQAFTQQPHASK